MNLTYSITPNNIVILQMLPNIFSFLQTSTSCQQAHMFGRWHRVDGT